MSCEYCKGMLIAGAEGHFMIGKRTLHSRNGDTVIQPIDKYFNDLVGKMRDSGIEACDA